MKLRSNIQRILSMLLVLVLVISAVPMQVFGADAAKTPIDAAVIFTDLHTSKSNYKQSTVEGIFGAVRNAGLPVSNIVSGGDAFSVNGDSDGSNGKYTGYTATISGYIRNAMGDANMPIHYVWSDHDRYAVQEDGSTLLDKTSHLVYGAGNDGVYGTADDGNYYIYLLSMADISTNDRYSAGFSSNRAKNGFTATVDQAIANFQADAAKLLKDRPLLIVSHQPLLDNRNDNGNAYKWCTAINTVAEEMDVAFFFGHNHKYDKSSDYYYAKGSTMSVCSDSSGNAKSVKLNFAHICGGYMEPTSTGSYSSSGTRRNVVMAVIIYDDAIQYTTYTSSGVYTGNYALNTTVARDHAAPAAPEEPEVTEPAPTEPEVTEPAPTEPAPTEPVTPEVPEEPVAEGKIWRKATTMEAGKRYILVNYGYNDSNVGTYAIGSDAAPVALEVKTDATGAYVVTDDESLAWVATANGTRFNLSNAVTGKYLRSTGTAYNNTSADLTVDTSVSSSTYSTFALETKNNCQILALRRSSSSNYYPLRYTGSQFQIRAASQVGTLNNWVTVFVETNENAHTHSYETVTVAPTCTEAGSVTTACACGDKTVEVIPALGHSYGCTETAPTCAQTGSKVYTCSVCAASYTETIPATGAHTYVSTTVAPTCTANGSVTEVCAVCGDTVVTVLPALGHTFQATVTAPTCTAEGLTVYTCGCGESYTEAIPALGHSFETSVTAPTCTEEGLTVFTCSCGESYSEIIPAAGHNHQAVVTAPTCTENGYTTYTCHCGDSYVADVVNPLGHAHEAVVTAPTCTTEGYTTYTCHCGDSYVADVVNPLGHTHEAVVTAPTCTENGFTTYTCACGDSYVADVVAALGHSYESVVTAPTCTAEGYTTYTCHCGDVYIAEQVAALGHSYTAVESGNYMVYTCHCGDTYSEKLTVELQYVKVSGLSENKFVITLSSNNKYYALSHKDNKLSAVQVTVSNNVITSEVTDDLVWDCSGNVLSYVDGETTRYLYAQPASGWMSWFGTPTLTISTTNSTALSFSSNKLKLGSYYLRYSGGSISLNRSGTTAVLFQGNET